MISIQEAITRVVDGHDLTGDEARAVIGAIMSGDATDAQIGALLVALRLKGETVDEITGAAQAMREKATPVKTSQTVVVDTCGTGGDHSGTFNISTATAFVVAGAGLCVAKHGNRAATSQCGSADVLAALGVNIDVGPDVVGRCLDDAGIGFLFAPALHGAMKHAIGPRREIGVRSLFNMLGPLTNPAGAARQLIGVYSESLTGPIAHVLGQLGSERAFVVHGSDGLDELTITGPSTVSELRDGTVTTTTFSPGDVGMDTVDPETLKGGDAEMNAGIVRRILDGDAGPTRDIVVLNAAAAIAAGGLAEGIAEAIPLAARSIDSGAAREKLEGLRALTQA